MNYYVDAEKISDLYLTNEPSRRFSDKVVSAEIRNVAEYEKEEKIKRTKNWIDETCKKFQMTPEFFLETF